MCHLPQRDDHTPPTSQSSTRIDCSLVGQVTESESSRHSTTASVAVTSSSSSSTSTSRRCKKHHQRLLSVVSPAQVIDIYIEVELCAGGESRAREYTPVLSISLELASDSVSFLVRSLTETQRLTDNLFGIILPFVWFSGSRGWWFCAWTSHVILSLIIFLWIRKIY